MGKHSHHAIHLFCTLRANFKQMTEGSQQLKKGIYFFGCTEQTQQPIILRADLCYGVGKQL